MRPLVDFLNHGILPFVGRSREAEQILSFWLGTGETQGLRAALLVGEAGTGKSRFVEEIVPQIARSGGLVIHTKLYPESATALAPLIAQAIWRSAGGAHLVKSEPEGSLASVSAALRRLARLRRTLLIVEDVHLLSHESHRELSALLDGLADDSLSILCSTRPVEIPVRGMLERYLIEQIELKGLGREDLSNLWSEIFGAAPAKEAVDLLYRATLGNVLAVRSALRGAIKSGALAPDAAGTTWKMAIPSDAFAETLRRNVLLLSEGMAAHLNEEERRAASELAQLGEVFSHEAASAMVGGREEVLEMLAFKGIIALSITHSTPLPGARSLRPLMAFTHTLLHSYFLQLPVDDRTAVVGILADDLPIYSTLPYNLLAEPGGTIEASKERLHRAIERALETVKALNGSPDWELGMQVWKGGEALFVRGRAEWSEREAFNIESTLLYHALLLQRRSYDEEYDRSLERFLRLTESLPSDDLAHHRLHALTYLYSRSLRLQHEQCESISREIDRLVDRHPWLPGTHAYIQYLDAFAMAARASDDMTMLDRFDEQLMIVTSNPEASSEFRRHARQKLSLHLIDIFDTEEKLQERLRTLDELEADAGRNDTRVPWHRVILMYELGEHHEVLDRISILLPRLRNHGLLRSYAQCRLLRACAHITLGEPLADVEKEIRDIIAQTSSESMSMLSRSICTYVVLAGMLRGERSWACRLFDEFLPTATGMSPDALLIIPLLGGREIQPLHIDAVSRLHATLSHLYSMLLGHDNPASEGIARVREILDAPLLKIETLNTVEVVIAMVRTADRVRPEHGMMQLLRPRIQVAVERSLEWLVERKLFVCAAPFLERHGEHLDPRTVKKWQTRISSGMRTRGAGKSTTQGSHRMRLSMLGTIEFVKPDGEIVRPRGSRLRTLLGLMVADRMLESPLTNREFYRLAAGDDDIERARNTVHAAMHRLRDSIGAAAVLADVEKPGLNLEVVDVDLLEAQRLLREATASARENAWMRASSSAMAALGISRGEVPFPSLYETFFEAAREDFENELRSTVLRIGRGLIREGDPASAREVLAAAFDAMPDDEEMAELLYDALSHLGKRAEAERVRMRSAITE
jgi:DNA-binding SARP family transcriptional activator